MIGLVFSGQGAQYSGMGKSLCQCSPAAKAIFDMAETIRPGTAEQCFTGSKEELTETRNTQPCMYCVEVAAAAALRERGVEADALAGFSLGEISALAWSGAVSLEDGFRLVARRGELMQKASEEAESGMVAVMKLSPEQVEELCRGFQQVYPVNYNCPGQIVVSGAAAEMEAVKAAVKAAKGRAVPLAVRGAFHSPFMATAAEGLAEYLKGQTFQAPRMPLYSNYTATPYEGDPNGGAFAELLSRQVVNPVRWQTIVENMIAAGVDTFIEAGPGKTLCGLIKKINKEVLTLRVEDEDSLNETVAALNGAE
ncbi:MAG: ACP S-malonyltransferase [Oscillospiraceae bacterium]|nr:ACP S-malonyltransferase [Oscillospiraceae bacterium]